MNNVEAKLKSLKTIEPNQSFILLSKKDILGLPERQAFMPFSNFSLSLSLALAAFLVIFMINGVNQDSSYTIANLQEMEKETSLSQDKINVSLQELNYHSDIASQANMALGEASSNPSYLNPSMLNKEIDRLNTLNNSNQNQIDQLLNQAIL